MILSSQNLLEKFQKIQKIIKTIFFLKNYILDESMSLNAQKIFLIFKN